MASGNSVRSTARLALALVAAILLANLLSATTAAVVFRRAIVQQGARTEFLVEQMLEYPDAPGDQAWSEWALLMQSRERAIADMTRSTHLMVFAELISSSLGVLLGWVLFRALRRLAAKEREVQRTVAKLEESNARLDTFAGRVAHDLRNAMAPTRLAAGLLRKSQSGGREVETVAGILDRSSSRMAQTIDALLEFSRMNVPNPQARSEIAGVVDGAREEVESLAQALGARVEADVAPAFVRGTSGALHTLVTNILNNAVKFLVDQPERRVRVTGRQRGEEYVLEIADTGPGIPAEVQSRLFDPFFRAPGVKAAGLGIGLSTAHQVATALGGAVSVDSAPGEGASFLIRLPLSPPPPDERTWAPHV